MHNFLWQNAPTIPKLCIAYKKDYHLFGLEVSVVHEVLAHFEPKKFDKNHKYF